MADSGQGRVMTAKSIRTRQRLIDASREVFIRDGVADSRVSDITRAAGVAHGTFYTYFESKHELFNELAAEALERLEAASSDIWSIDLPPDQALGYVLGAWVTAYQAEAPVLMLIDGAGPQAADLLQARSEMSARMIERSIEVVSRFQRAGLADPQLDTDCAATALTVMVQAVARRLATRESDFSMPLVIETLVRLWRGGIGLEPVRAPVKPAG